MKSRFKSTGIRSITLCLALAASAGFAAICRAQGTDPNLQPAKEAQDEQNQQLKERSMSQTPTPPPAKPDPAEEAAYKAFFDAGTENPDARIQLGNDFLQKYPMSHYVQSVYTGLIQAYYAKQDWTNFYADADKALAINPDNVPVLTMVGWVIPHVINPQDPDAQKNLDKAESYEKHAIVLIGTMVKPATMTDEQFSQSKASVLSQAHSGLGLVYFRRQQFADSVTELQQSTQAASNPDQTDYFVLGLDLQSLGRLPEAADAFNHCSQIAGGLQDRCKQSADNAKKQAAQAK
jgi:tetratricopeptide (TPR) repeat protein